MHQVKRAAFHWWHPPRRVRPCAAPGGADILLAEPDYEVRAVMEPNDTRWSLQWGMRRVGAAEAWSHSWPRLQQAQLQAAAAHAAGSAGPGAGGRVTVCVIDTGVDYTHSELAPNMHPAVGYNALDGSGDPYDEHGHGTHCAGTIGGRSRVPAPACAQQGLGMQRGNMCSRGMRPPGWAVLPHALGRLALLLVHPACLSALQPPWA